MLLGLCLAPVASAAETPRPEGAVNLAPAEVAPSGTSELRSRTFLGTNLARRAMFRTMDRKYGDKWRYRYPGSRIECPRRIDKTRLGCQVGWGIGDLSLTTVLRVRLLPGDEYSEIVLAGRSVQIDQYCVYVKRPDNRKLCRSQHRVGPIYWSVR